MRVLLDTHTLLWAVDNPSMLSASAMSAIQEPANERLLSAATIWELAIKVAQGKLHFSIPYRDWMAVAIRDLKLTVLPITVEYADRQITLPGHHKDPFDRFLVAQSLVERIAIVSADVVFDAYEVDRIW